MMAMAQPFTTHPGMAGHAGIAHGGQPMVQGHPSNQGVPGGQHPGASMGQQMHQGIAGPGGPQVTQGGPMMGMMQGGGPPGGVSGPTPSAHALQHLNPQPHHNQMFAGQQIPQAMANNPQLIAQQQQVQVQQQQRVMQQQAMMQQRLQQQQQAQQQQPNGGMVPNIANPPMTEAQFLQNNQAMRGVNLPPHLVAQQQQAQAQQQAHNNARLQQQQQQQQQAQLQQQQAAAQQHQLQQSQQAQQAQRNQQQQQQQQAIAQAQQTAMQQAVSNAASTQGQPAPQPQINSQPQVPGPDAQAVAAAQRQQAQQAQMQQQQEQQNQRQQQQQQQQQNQASQQPQQQQTPQGQQQPQQPQQGQQQPQQQLNPQQQQVQQQHAQQQAQLQHQQRQAAHAAALMQQPHIQKTGLSVLRLLTFGDKLSQASITYRPQPNGRPDGQQQVRRKADDISYWQDFVENFFSPKGILRQAMWSASNEDTKQFEISNAALARYYFLHFESGIQNMQMILENAVEKNLNGGIHIVEARSTFIYWSRNGHQLILKGQLRAQFDQQTKIDILDLITTEHSEYIPRTTLVQAAAESPEIKQSPNTSKATGKRAQQRQKQQQLENQPPQVSVPETAFHDSGTTPAVWQFLELESCIALMGPLFQFSHQRPQLNPSEALSQLCNHFSNEQEQRQIAQQQHGQNPQFNPAMHHPGQPTPQQHNLNAFQQNNNFLSPAHAHLSLPNQNSNMSASPATLSNHPTPSMQNLALQNSMQQGGVSMVAQASHQGTNPSAGGTPGGSANASPSVTNKRRRPSGVGLGVGGGGEEVVEVNGVGGGANKVKQSPRPGGKRQKANG